MRQWNAFKIAVEIEIKPQAQSEREWDVSIATAWG